MSPQEREQLAADHAVGLTEGVTAAEAEGLLAADHAFARMVGDWRIQLVELDETAPATPPSAALWSRIAAETAAMRSTAPAGARPRPLAGLWQSLAFWRGAGLVAAMGALLLGLGLAGALRQAARAPVLVTVLLTDGNRPGAVVNTFADGRSELLPLADIPVPAGRALQIWTLWDRARGPVPVGLIDVARRTPLSLDNLPRPAPDQLFEITLEPAGGSPTGRPTGPILMKGTASTAL